MSSSDHWFSRDMLVFGGVIYKTSSTSKTKPFVEHFTWYKQFKVECVSWHLWTKFQVAGWCPSCRLSSAICRRQLRCRCNSACRSLWENNRKHEKTIANMRKRMISFLLFWLRSWDQRSQPFLEMAKVFEQPTPVKSLFGDPSDWQVGLQ